MRLRRRTPDRRGRTASLRRSIVVVTRVPSGVEVVEKETIGVDKPETAAISESRNPWVLLWL